jgi:hypothetical protein
MYLCEDICFNGFEGEIIQLELAQATDVDDFFDLGDRTRGHTRHQLHLGNASGK